jgi:signal peptidase
VTAALRALRAVLLTAVCVTALATSVGALYGYRVVAVTSGSMRPAYAVGDALVVRTGVRPAGPGAVVVFAVGPGLVAHRVVAVRTVGAEPWYVTRGDANADPDPDAVPASRVYGTVAGHVPWLGRPLYAATTPRARLVLLAFLLLLVTPDLVRLAGGRRPQANGAHRRQPQ